MQITSIAAIEARVPAPSAALGLQYLKTSVRGCRGGGDVLTWEKCTDWRDCLAYWWSAVARPSVPFPKPVNPTIVFLICGPLVEVLPPQKSRAGLPSFNLFICHSEEERKNKLKGRQQQSIRQVLGIPHIVTETSPDLPYPMFNDVLITASPESQDFQGVGGLCCKVFQRAKPYSGEKKTGTWNQWLPANLVKILVCISQTIQTSAWCG